MGRPRIVMQLTTAAIVAVLGFGLGQILGERRVAGTAGGCPDLRALAPAQAQLTVNSEQRTGVAVLPTGRQVAFSLDVNPASCADSVTQQLVAQAKVDLAVHQQAVCTELTLVATGRAPLPVKRGYKIDLEALRQYLAKQCAMVM